MITVGLTTWSEHPQIIMNPKTALADYAGHFPAVEVDTPFYGIPTIKTVTNWVDQTPKAFQFVPKVNQVMTLHRKWQEYYTDEKIVFELYLQAMLPLIEAKKVKAFLFQFPPYFDCTSEHIVYLRKIRKWFKDLPIAIEFRNRTWYSERYLSQTLRFLQAEQWIHVVVDEPQTQTNSVPMVLQTTNQKLTILRLHGRNLDGWLKSGDPDWRKKRTLYRYNEAELTDLAEKIRFLEEQSKEICVIFNNNSGGDACDNAKSLQKILGLSFDGLGPQQLDLFT